MSDKAKRTWRVPLIWSVAGTVCVDAENEEEAIKLALGPHVPLPADPVYLGDSIMVDETIGVTEVWPRLIRRT